MEEIEGNGGLGRQAMKEIEVNPNLNLLDQGKQKTLDAQLNPNLNLLDQGKKKTLDAQLNPNLNLLDQGKQTLDAQLSPNLNLLDQGKQTLDAQVNPNLNLLDQGKKKTLDAQVNPNLNLLDQGKQKTLDAQLNPNLNLLDQGKQTLDGRRKPLLPRPPPIGEDPQINPFSDPRPPLLDTTSTLSLLRLVFVVPLALPLFILRVLLLLLLIVAAYISVKLSLLGVKDPLLKPFSPLRRSSLWPTRLCVRALLFFVFGYYYIPVKGSCAPREAAPIIVCNHISFLEPLFIFFAHMPVLVSAKENAELPLVGVFLQALQIIPVDRVSPDSRHDAASQIKKRAMDNRWPHVGIFPEGTTTNGKVLISFKSGAFSPGLPVQPMVVRYKNVNPAWVNSGPYPVLLHLMTQPINFMEVEYLPVAVPRRHEVEHPRIFAQRVRRSMAQVLNVKFTDHTFLDAKLAIEAVKLLEPPELTLAEFGIMERLFHLDYQMAKSYLEKFSAMDTTHSGFLRIDQFLDALNLPLTPITQEVFQLFDTAEKGFINFREFVAGMAFLSTETSFSKTVEAAFHACDTDHDGLLSWPEVERSVKNILPEMDSSSALKLFNVLDTNQDGVVSWDEFSIYLKNNPEYLAVIMAARPDLLNVHK